MSVQKGFYCSIEGIDASGKSTIINHILSQMDKDKTLMTRMPGGSEFAEKYRAACRSEDIDGVTQLLFYAALNRDASIRTIKTNIEKGYNVISDRGWVSTLVYQAMTADREKLLLKIIEDEEIPMPDLVIYLDIPLSVTLERENKRGDQALESGQDDRYSKFDIEHKEKIKEGYDRFFGRPLETTHYQEKEDAFNLRDGFAVMWKLRHRLAKKIVVIDANRPLSEVMADVINAIKENTK